MTSQYRGVTYSKKSQKWQAAINMGGTHVHLGTHVSELDAAVAFDKAALCIRGDKAKINFPLSNYRDQTGNLVLDQTILVKLQAASSDKASGRKKKRKLGPDGQHVTLDEDLERHAQLSSHLAQILQANGVAIPHPAGGDTPVYLSNTMPPHAVHTEGMVGRVGPPEATLDQAAWTAFNSIVAACVPPGARLRGLVPHSATRCMGVLFEEPMTAEVAAAAAAAGAEPVVDPAAAAAAAAAADTGTDAAAAAAPAVDGTTTAPGGSSTASPGTEGSEAAPAATGGAPVPVDATGAPAAGTTATAVGNGGAAAAAAGDSAGAPAAGAGDVPGQEGMATATGAAVGAGTAPDAVGGTATEVAIVPVVPIPDGAVQIGAVVWVGGAEMARNVFHDEASARHFIHTFIEAMASMSTITPAAPADGSAALMQALTSALATGQAWPAGDAAAGGDAAMQLAIAAAAAGGAGDPAGAEVTAQLAAQLAGMQGAAGPAGAVGAPMDAYQMILNAIGDPNMTPEQQAALLEAAAGMQPGAVPGVDGQVAMQVANGDGDAAAGPGAAPEIKPDVAAGAQAAADAAAGMPAGGDAISAEAQQAVAMAAAAAAAAPGGAPSQEAAAEALRTLAALMPSAAGGDATAAAAPPPADAAAVAAQLGASDGAAPAPEGAAGAPGALPLFTGGSAQ